MNRIALATCSALPHLHVDDAPLVAALAARDAQAEAAVWDDEAVAWDSYDLVVIRSTWDYAQRRPEFLEWARRCLLYTSPSPRDGLLSRMPSSA